MTVRPFVLPEPTICDVACFKAPGHEGPCQKWAGDPCDHCDQSARWRAPNGGGVCDAHRGTA